MTHNKKIKIVVLSGNSNFVCLGHNRFEGFHMNFLVNQANIYLFIFFFNAPWGQTLSLKGASPSLSLSKSSSQSSESSSESSSLTSSSANK